MWVCVCVMSLESQHTNTVEWLSSADSDRQVHPQSVLARHAAESIHTALPQANMKVSALIWFHIAKQNPHTELCLFNSNTKRLEATYQRLTEKHTVLADINDFEESEKM